MGQRVDLSPRGGSVPLPSQEMGSMTVNQRLVVAPPGYSGETKGLLARVISALMDAIRRFCAGLFFSSEEITQILDQLDKLAALSLEGKPLSLEDRQEELEKLLQGLSDRGVRYILGEFAKKISDSSTTEHADPGRIKAEVDLFDKLCERSYLKSSSELFQHFLGECVMGRLEPRERLKIYTALRRGNSISISRLLNFYKFRWLFKRCAQEKCVDGAMFSNLLTLTPRNVEQAFCLLGHIAKHVLVEGNAFHDVTMEDNVDLFDALFKAFYEKSSLDNDGYSLQNCALWVLNQLEEKDREIAIGVLGEHGSVLMA